jgi:hypothetical protein
MSSPSARSWTSAREGFSPISEGEAEKRGSMASPGLAADMLKRKKPGLASRLLLVEADTLPFI